MEVLAKESKYLLQKIIISFDAPPKQQANKILDDEGHNFQWLNYAIFFSDEKRENWFVYKTPLEPWGVKRTGGQQVFVSDPDEHVVKNEDPGITEKEVEAHPSFKKYLKGPELSPNLPEPSMTYVQSYNGHRISEFTKTQFLHNIEDSKDEGGKPFYLMVTKKGLYTPLGRGPFGNKGTPGHFARAVRAAMEKNPGFDIMERLVQKQRTVKTPSHSKEHETGGFNILRKWEQKKQHHSPTKTDVDNGFGVMKKLVKHPVKIKK
jgi:hypothetical protein